MRRVSMATRDELVVVLRERYAGSGRAERGRILDEFSAVTGFHRKHAMRLLRGGQTNQQRGPRPRRRIYDDAVREALIVVWEASDILPSLAALVTLCTAKPVCLRIQHGVQSLFNRPANHLAKMIPLPRLI